MPKVVVDTAKCTGCGTCESTCPMSVFKIKNGKATIVNEEVCIACHACEASCPEGAIIVHDD